VTRSLHHPTRAGDELTVKGDWINREFRERLHPPARVSILVAADPPRHRCKHGLSIHVGTVGVTILVLVGVVKR